MQSFVSDGAEFEIPECGCAISHQTDCFANKSASASDHRALTVDAGVDDCAPAFGIPEDDYFNLNRVIESLNLGDREIGSTEWENM